MLALFAGSDPPRYEEIAEKLGMKVGSIGPTRVRCFKKLEKILADIKPAAVYFVEDEGERTAIMIVDMKSPSDLPKIAEPWFLTFDARVQARPAMTPEDLAKAGLEELGKRYG